MRRVGPSEDSGPMFFLVFEITPSVWDTRCYWNVDAANRGARVIKAKGRLAFVEVR